MSDEALLASLRDRTRDEIGRAVPRGPVALLDFPDYGNPGDSAIWLGALACLASLGFDPPAYTSDQRTFDESALRRALPHGTILITGGGNLGDLWPRHQAFRERIVRAFPDHAIVQLPQSIHFDDAAALDAARAAFSSHENLTLLVRDERSLRTARESLGCRASLCSDLAFSLERDAEPLRGAIAARPEADILRLLRTDHEASRRSQPVARGVDWMDDVSSPLKMFTRWLSARPTNATTRSVLSACYPRLARQRLRRGCALVRSARVLVTDRLHGHVLAVLLGVPHVMLGDRNGKLRGFVDTWTSSASTLRWATNHDEASRLAKELLACS